MPQPCFDLAGLAQQFDLRLLEFKIDIEESEIFRTLSDSRVLLVFGSELGRVGSSRSGLQLGHKSGSLLLSQLLLELGDLRLGAEFPDVGAEFVLSVEFLLLSVVGLMQSAGGRGGRFLSLGAMTLIENGQLACTPTPPLLYWKC